MDHNQKQLIKHKEGFVQALREWYLVHHRKLPWRTEPSLYKTIVSEFMLQQTQVDTVLPYFDRWLKAFPGFLELSQATEDQAVKLWEGLGYYTRARNLLKFAKHYTAALPKPVKELEWLEYPGVGPYTAAAISSIGFSEPAAVVDGNLVRILSRLANIEILFKDGTSSVKILRPLAQALLDEKDPGTHNQAMMELGATVCFRQKPLCTVCPVVQFCQAARLGNASSLPRIERRKTEVVVLKRLWVIEGDKILLHKRPEHSKRLANIYEIPLAENLVKNLDKDQLLTQKKRGISNQLFTEEIYQPTLTPMLKRTIQKQQKIDNLYWVSKGVLDQITLSGPHRKWINELLNQSKKAKKSVTSS